MEIKHTSKFNVLRIIIDLANNLELYFILMCATQYNNLYHTKKTCGVIIKVRHLFF